MLLRNDIDVKVTETSVAHTVLTVIFDGTLWLHSVTVKIAIVARNVGRTAAKFTEFPMGARGRRR